jgi:antitoxin HicB
MKTKSGRKSKDKSLTEKKDLAYYMTLHYPYTMEQYEEDGKIHFSLSIPDLPGCGAIGETMEQALINLEKAKEAWIELCLEEGLSIPEPELEDEFSGKFLLRIPPSLHMMLSKLAEKEGKSLNQCIRSILEAKISQENNLESHDIAILIREILREEIIPLSQRLTSLEESFNSISDAPRSSQQYSYGYYGSTLQPAMEMFGKVPRLTQRGTIRTPLVSQIGQSAQSGQITDTMHGQLPQSDQSRSR